MARTMITANRALFAKLEAFASLRGQAVSSPGARRYLEGDDESDAELASLVVVSNVEFGLHRSLVHMMLNDEHRIGLVGFDFAEVPLGFEEVAVSPGAFVAVITSTTTQPQVSAGSVKNAVDVASMDDADYEGHDYETMQTLFPPIRMLRSFGDTDAASIERTFLALCIDECAINGSWVSSYFAEELKVMCELDVPFMPYAALCRSVFDLDPRTMYMALYRCIEATYAFEQCRVLVEKLDLQISWTRLAQTLQDDLKWRPRERSSLDVILRYAAQQDLTDLCTACGQEPGGDAAQSAGGVIYELRNRIVHFGADRKSVGVDEYDWNQVCALLVRIVFHVFTTAFGHIATNALTVKDQGGTS